MSEKYIIAESGIGTFFDAVAKAGNRILGPRHVGDRIEITELARPAELAKDGQATVSAKATVFPKVERLLQFRFEGKNVAVEDVEPGIRPTVLFGVHPCEARAFHALDVVFNWDYKDKFFNQRLASITVVTMSCTDADDSCFCTSVGSRPDDPEGSDIVLRPLRSGGYLADVLTEKGRSLVALAKDTFCPLSGEPDLAPTATVAPAFDAKSLQSKLAGKFDSPVWLDQSLRCLGCGACAFVCPTCVCFSLEDEADPRAGQRLRTWDSCGMRLFTLHASGHNPRDKQSQRWRQRIYHKFVYYPDRWKTLGCVGCGKCSRACPVDMNLKEHLAEAAR